MTFDLWDTETSNFYGQFADERKALALVRKLVAHYGEGYAQDLGLGRVTGEGEVLTPLSGAALIARVNEVLSDQETADRRVIHSAAHVDCSASRSQAMSQGH
jgi:hypothetical protein